ncbi:DUF5916 domain-containing protein [Acidobacteriota bacterium]
MKRRMLLTAVLVMFLIQPALIGADDKEENTNKIIPERSVETVVIDGQLQESIWQKSPLRKIFITFSPGYGEQLDQDTWIWTAYDLKNLYFAFKCFDSEPDKIKMSVAHRDRITMDDQVGIRLDSIDSKQTSFEFYINPKGIQADAVNSSVSVEGADFSSDFVWESASASFDEGYIVEVRIPLESLRFQAAEEVSMGVSFFRQISRLGIRAAWPEIKAGQTVYNSMASIIYRDLKGALKLEVLPNLAYTSYDNRQTQDYWTQNRDTNFGFGLKYGITSAMTVEATWNPDFSQVESDSFQVEVNQRYPIFYSEKRPFFMESKEVMDLAVVKWGLMPVPVHTRFIVDPQWAAKFSGSAGRMSFAFLAANDRSAGRQWDMGINPNEGESALYGVVRAKYNIGSDNSVGFIYSGRHFAGQRNDVVGGDLKYRFTENLRGTLSYLRSASREDAGASLREGNSVNAMLEYRSSHFFAMAAYELYDKDFSMATAFVQRLGVSRILVGMGPAFDLDLKPVPWLKRMVPYIYYLKLHDLQTQMDDRAWILGLTLNFAPMGTASFEYYNEQEAWAGNLFKKNYFHGEGLIQIFKWLQLIGMSNIGEAIYYHPVSPFLGDGQTYSLGASIQPDNKVNIGLEYLYTTLRQKLDRQNVYSVNLYNIRATYQFNKYFFIRGILRYNSFQQRLLTDFLASFTFIPGTVVHLGYGTLHLKTRWQENHWVPGMGDLLPMKRGLIFKVSYLWRVG